VALGRLGWSLRHIERTTGVGHQLRVLFFERVGDVLEEDEAEDDVLADRARRGTAD
jgi:hypothetical protein